MHYCCAQAWKNSEAVEHLTEALGPHELDLPLQGGGGGGGVKSLSAAITLSKLHHAVRYGDMLGVCDCLAKRGHIDRTNINAPTDDGYCPIHLAARIGDVELMRLLLGSGCAIYIYDFSERHVPHVLFHIARWG